MAAEAQAGTAKKTFHLEIITPDKQFFIGEAEGLVLPALDGALGIETGHEPICGFARTGLGSMPWWARDSPRSCLTG